MPAREPGWWYAQAPRVPARVLAPFAAVWGALAGRRMEQAPAYRSRLPVICVGNFTAGGTGKTPLTLHLARLLAAKGERPVILTRGYGGRLSGPHLVDRTRDTAADVGDEPLLLARHAPVVVARDRAAGARAIEARAGGDVASVILMDDGLQNPSLGKDFRIAVVDGGRGVGNGLVMPAGPLRAPLGVQLARVDAIVINRPRLDGRRAEATAAWLAARFGGPILIGGVAPDIGSIDVRGRRLVALAGIANPARFYDLLRELGAEIAAVAEFADHHPLSEAEARGVMALAAQHSATIITTEKDLARLEGAEGACGALREAAVALPIRQTFEAGDDARLQALVLAAIERRREATA